jgi:holliday junction DNA helicase RuvA
MIGMLRGVLLQKSPPNLVLDVQGVGYEVEAPMTTFYNLPDIGVETRLYTHLVVREDAHILFGFGSEVERSLFRLLIKVNGVGPKLALTILSGQTADEFSRSIHQGDTQALVKLPGVGKKTAERLVIELRDKLPTTVPTTTNPLPASIPQVNAAQEAISALCSLGYKPQDAAKMVQATQPDGKRCEDIIRLALQGARR